MPPLPSIPPRPSAMSWARAVPVLAACVIFDALRILFEQFWFFGPALLGIATNAVLGGGLIGKAAGVVVGGAAGFAGGGFFEIFGAVMAIAVAVLGWLVVLFLLIILNGRLFKTLATGWLWSLLGLGVSALPIVGTVPALTLTTLKLYHAQIKKDKVALKEWEERAQSVLRAAERAWSAAERARALDEAAAEGAANGEEIPAGAEQAA